MTQRATSTGILALLVLMLGLQGCGGPPPPGRPDPQAVLRVLVQRLLPADEENRALIVVHEKTAVDHSLFDPVHRPGYTPAMVRREARDSIEEQMQSLRAETLDAYMEANRDRQDLRTTLGDVDGVAYLSVEVKEALYEHADDFYVAMRMRFPGSRRLVGLSMPGFSRDGRQALVYVSVMEDYEAGSGDYYLLEQRDGRWTVTDVLQVWLS